MSRIDPTARVEDGAMIGDDVTIGPYCLVGPHVIIGAGTTLVSHVNISARTTIGENCTIHPFVSLGTPPQILNYAEAPTELVIGKNCVIREGVTMNCGSVKGGGITRVGDRGYFMNNAHVGHDCRVGNDVVFATSATLGGHCDIGDFVFFGGLSAAHQFVRIGAQVMVGGVSGVRGDVVPFAMVNGQRARLEGLNLVGMKRRGFGRERIRTVQAFDTELFHGAGTFAERVAEWRPLRGLESTDPAISEILAFIDTDRHHSLCMPERARTHS
jgi:UDP-N-acetylglucosamine acyltransferase